MPQRAGASRDNHLHHSTSYEAGHKPIQVLDAGGEGEGTGFAGWDLPKACPSPPTTPLPHPPPPSPKPVPVYRGATVGLGPRRHVGCSEERPCPDRRPCASGPAPAGPAAAASVGSCTRTVKSRARRRPPRACEAVTCTERCAGAPPPPRVAATNVPPVRCAREGGRCAVCLVGGEEVMGTPLALTRT